MKSVCCVLGPASAVVYVSCKSNGRPGMLPHRQQPALHACVYQRVSVMRLLYVSHAGKAGLHTGT